MANLAEIIERGFVTFMDDQATYDAATWRLIRQRRPLIEIGKRRQGFCIEMMITGRSLTSEQQHALRTLAEGYGADDYAVGRNGARFAYMTCEAAVALAQGIVVVTGIPKEKKPKSDVPRYILRQLEKAERPIEREYLANGNGPKSRAEREAELAKCR